VPLELCCELSSQLDRKRQATMRGAEVAGIFMR
jgi:hypothetical protein